MEWIGLTAASSVLSGCGTTSVFDKGASGSKPNIIVILADDLGYGHFAANMDDYTKDHLNRLYIERDVVNNDDLYDIDKAMAAARQSTRYMTQMAREGVRMAEAYVPLPLCAPSRAALMTSRYPQRYGAYCNEDVGHKVGLTTDEYVLAQALKHNGYTNGIIGKWHLGQFQGNVSTNPAQHPLNRGFDYYFGFNHSTSVYYDPDHIFRNHEKVKLDKYTTDAFTEDALDFIEKNKENPFFLYLAYNTPHGPLDKDAPEKYLSRFDTGNHRVNNYNAYVAALDDGIGAIMDKLKETGVDEKTMVVFFSDNGPSGYNKVVLPAAGPLRGQKGHIWQGGTRVSMVARWPKTLPAGKVYRGLISSMDIMATAVEISGSEIPADVKLDGKNFLPAVQGKTKKPVHDMLFFAGQHCDFWGIKGPFGTLGQDWRKVDDRGNSAVGWAVRKDNLMLRYWGETQNYELYDVVKDPGEKNNIYGEKYKSEVKEMKQAYKKWFSQMKEPVNMNKQKWQQLVPKY